MSVDRTLDESPNDRSSSFKFPSGISSSGSEGGNSKSLGDAVVGANPWEGDGHSVRGRLNSSGGGGRVLGFNGGLS